MSNTEKTEIEQISLAINSGIGHFFSGLVQVMDAHAKGEVAVAKEVGSEAYTELRKQQSADSLAALVDSNAALVAVAGQYADVLRAAIPVAAAAIAVEQQRNSVRAAAEDRKTAIIEQIATGLEVETVRIDAYSTDFKMRSTTRDATEAEMKTLKGRVAKLQNDVAKLVGANGIDTDDYVDEAIGK